MGAITAAAGSDGTAWPAVVVLGALLVGAIALIVVFLRVVTNRNGALDRTVDRLTRQPSWTRLGQRPAQVRRSQQFTAAAGAALLFAVALLLGGLLMDQLTR